MRTKILLMLLVYCWVLIGCKPQSKKTSILSVNTPTRQTIIKTSPPITATNTLVSLSASSPTVTLTLVSRVITPVSLVTHTRTPTGTRYIPAITRTPAPGQSSPTPLPAIPSQDAKSILEGFVRDNGGCKLPCLLGLTPGLSDRSSADSFNSYFRDHSFRTQDRMDGINVWGPVNSYSNGMMLEFDRNNIGVTIDFGYTLNKGLVDVINLVGEAYQHMEDGDPKMLYGDPYFEELLRKYSLSNILVAYGPPAQIFIRVYPDDVRNPSPPAQYQVEFVLFYAQQGFAIQYTALRKDQGEDFIGCSSKVHSMSITAWYPREVSTLTEAVRTFPHIASIAAINVDAYKPIEEVSSLTIDGFYEKYKQENSDGCVQTNRKYWPTQEP